MGLLGCGHPLSVHRSTATLISMAGKGVTFGEYLARERERKGWTHRELADRIHISSEKTIQAWEADRSDPQARNLGELARAFEWDSNWVIALFGGPEPQNLKGISSEVATRPALRRLFAVARQLDNEQVAVVARMAAAGWSDGVKAEDRAV